MTNQQILKTAIQKAIDGRWEGFSYRKNTLTGPEPNWFLTTKYFSDIHQFADVKTGIDCELNELIFNHDFAKALWGEEHVTGIYYSNKDGSTKEFDLNMWQYHLQNMVIADDLIKYLGDNL